ncbi:MAG TPA: hypothetical protein VJJ47_00765 [Candidatus Paceibacterota bacterium]
MEHPKAPQPDDAAVDAVYLERGIVSIDGLAEGLTLEQHRRVAVLGSELAKEHFTAAHQAGLI